MLVCVCILVRLAASDQKEHRPGRGQIKTGRTKCNKRTTEREEGGGEGEAVGQEDFKTLHPKLILWAYVPVRTGPGFYSNSNSAHSQTEINRILRYTQLLIKIFAQMSAALQGKLQGAASV